MSSIDERIVEMKFDNKQFEEGIQTSLKSIENLEKKLDIKGSSKSLLDLSSATKSVGDLDSKVRGLSFGHLESAISSISSRFTNLGIIGVTALQRIANKAIDTGERMIKSLTIEPVSQGYEEYELKMGSIQTIMASTGEPLQKVNSYLNELNHYADMTIYSFSDMTSNIGKFTNAGVSLEKSVKAIQGVSNVAAVSGANANEASRAMYNFAQALSAGYVKLIDWKSIENANMATVEFKQQLIDTAVEMGTLTKAANGMYQVVGNEKHLLSATSNFNEYLSDQWLTSNVLIETLGRYADEETEIGRKAFAAAQDVKTFTQLMDTLKEAAGSGWAESFEIMVGDFEEAKALWTSVSNIVGGALDKQAEARNYILYQWKDLGGRTAAIEALGNAFKALANIGTAVKNAFESIFPPMTGQRLYDITEKVRSFTERLKNLLYYNAETEVSFEETGIEVDKTTTTMWNMSRVLWNIQRVFKGVFAVVGIGVDFVKALGQSFLKLLEFAAPSLKGILEYFGNLGDRIVEFRESLKGDNFFGNALAKLIPVAEAIRDVIHSIIDGVIDLGTSIWNYLQESGIITKVNDSLLGFLGNVASRVPEAIRTIGQYVAKVFDWIKTNEVVKKVIDGAVNVFNRVVENVPRVVSAIKEFALGVYDWIKNNETFNKWLGKIRDFFATFVDGLIDFKNRAIQAIKEFLGFNTSEYDNVGENFQKKFEPFSKVGEWFKGILESVKANWSKSATFFENIVNLFKNAIEKIVEFWNKYDIGGKIRAVFSGVIDAFRWLWDKISGANVGELLQNVFKGYAILSVIRSILNFSKASNTFTRSLQNVSKGIQTFLKNKSKGASTLGSTLLKIAASIGIVVAAVVALSTIDPEKLDTAMKKLAILAAGLIAFTGILALFKGAGEGVGNLGAGIIKMAGGIAILIGAVWLLGKMDFLTLAKGIGAVAAIMVSLALATSLMKDNQKISIGFISLAASILVLTFAIKRLGRMKAGEAIKGIAGLGVVLLELALFMRAAGGNGLTAKFGSLIGMAALIGILSGALKDLGKLKWSQILKGVVSLGAILIALKAAMKAAPTDFKGSLTAIVGIIALGAAMFAFYKLVESLDDVQADKIGAIGISLGAILSSLAAAFKVFSTISPIAAVKGLAAIAIAIGGLIGVLALIGVITDAIGSTKGLETAGTVLQLAGEAIGKLIGGVVGGFSAGASASLPAVATNLDTFMTNLTPFMEKIKGFDDSVSSGVDNLVSALISMTGAELLEGLASLVGSGGFVAFSAKLPTFGENITAFCDSIKDITTDKVQAVANAGQVMADLATNLPKVGGIIGFFAGEQSLATFGADLASFGPDIALFAASVKDIETGDMEKLAPVLTALGDAANSVPAEAALARWIGVKSNLETFAEDLVSLGPKLFEFSVSARSIEPASIENASGALKALSEAADAVPKESVLSRWIGVKSNLSTFVDDLNALGPALFKLSVASMLTSSDSILNIVPVLEALESVAASAPDINVFTQWFGSTTEFGAFTGDLISLGEALSSFNTSIDGINAENFKAITSALTGFISDANSFDEGFMGTLGLANAMGEIAAAAASSFTEGFTNEAANLTSAAAAMCDSLIAGISDNEAKFTASGLLLMTAFSTAISGSSMLASNAVRTMAAAAVMAITGYYSAFYNAGVNVAIGFANGINAGRGLAQAAAASVAAAALSAATAALGIHSPSKEFERIGYYSDKGLANGLLNHTGIIQNAGESIADAAISPVSSALSILSEIVNSEFDYSPVIRPVLDLDSLREDAASMGSLLGTTPIGGASGLFNRSVWSAANSAYAANGNFGGSMNVVAAVNDLGAKFDSLSEAVKNMQLVMDSGVVAGHIATRVDRRLGEMTVHKERGN